MIISKPRHSCDGSGCILPTMETDKGKALQETKNVGDEISGQCAVVLVIVNCVTISGRTSKLLIQMDRVRLKMQKAAEVRKTL